jgi:hypothetical protein
MGGVKRQQDKERRQEEKPFHGGNPLKDLHESAACNELIPLSRIFRKDLSRRMSEVP